MADASDFDREAKAAARAFGRNRKWAVPGNYQTPLGDDESAFRTWVKKNSIPFDPDNPVSDYDMRGYFLARMQGEAGDTHTNKNDGRPHFPDTFKTPYHKSFSAESKYAIPGAPVWINDHQLADPKTGRVIFDETAP